VLLGGVPDRPAQLTGDAEVGHRISHPEAQGIIDRGGAVIQQEALRARSAITNSGTCW
jgi:hypothetical protein